MITLNTFIKSKRIEVKGNRFKQCFKLTGLTSLKIAIDTALKHKGIDSNRLDEITQTLFLNNPQQYSLDGLQFVKIRNGYLIKYE